MPIKGVKLWNNLEDDFKMCRNTWRLKGLFKGGQKLQNIRNIIVVT